MNKLVEVLSWVEKEKANSAVTIKKIALANCEGWIFDENIHRIDNHFFKIVGIKNNIVSQPIIYQNEIGILGLIAKQIGNELFFLIQAKIEPGNLNYVQLSPTVQATKSNFTQKHGGRKPLYLEYFLNPGQVIVDQLQSEQSSRFYKKRNRNMIVLTTDEIPETEKFKWISLSVLRQLMRFDNLVNMDTRTVLSCLPIRFMNIPFGDDAFRESVLHKNIIEDISSMYKIINNFKMFSDDEPVLCNLSEINNWFFDGKEIKAKEDAAFKVCFCDIAIEGREVARWCQPLFEAASIATFGLIFCEDNGRYSFLVRAKPEIGCFDHIEIGPSVQIDDPNHENNIVESMFFELCKNRQSVVADVLLSEEGGRFYHEQNRNIVVKSDRMFAVPDDYFWVSFGALNALTQINNCLNIQLRNLLVLSEFSYDE